MPQDYLGVEKRYYEPSDQGVEKKIKERLDRWRQIIAEAKGKAGEKGAGKARGEKGEERGKKEEGRAETEMKRET